MDGTTYRIGHPRCAMDERDRDRENINQIFSLQYFGELIDSDLDVTAE